MKTWETPKLIVLARGKPEEAILGACKHHNLGLPNSGPLHALNICAMVEDPGVSCSDACNAMSET